MASVAAALLLALLAACGGGDQPALEGTPGESPAGTPTFDTIAAGKLTAGSDIPYPPFEFNDPSGKLVGFDVELVEEVAERLGLEVEWKDANFDTIFTSLAAGRFDVVASSVTAYAPEGSPAAADVAKRQKIVSFSVPYYSSLQSLAANTKRTPDIRSTDDLESGDRVAVQRGTTGRSWAQENLKPKGVQIVEFVKAPQMFEALEAGQVKGVVNDLPVSLDAIKKKPDLKVVQQIETGEQYAICVNKENPGLLEAINVTLQQLFKDGTYTQLFKKYFPDQELPAYAEE